MIKKKIKQKHTIFIYCEGQTDHSFIQYLINIFSNFEEKNIESKKGQGGGPSIMIRKTAREPGEYDERYIFLDVDQRENKDKKKCEDDARRQGIELIWSDPCLEGLLLQILNGHPQMSDSQKYKKYFKEEYNSNKRQYDSEMFERLFPKEKLVSKKEKIPTLKELIEIVNNIGDQKTHGKGI